MNVVPLLHAHQFLTMLNIFTLTTTKNAARLFLFLSIHHFRHGVLVITYTAQILLKRTMMPKTPPPPTERDERTAARLSVLRTLDIAAAREWARRYGFGLLGDDEVILRSLHEARAEERLISPALRAASKRWLRGHPK